MKKNFVVWIADAIRSNTAPFSRIASLDSVCYEHEIAFLYFK